MSLPRESASSRWPQRHRYVHGYCTHTLLISAAAISSPLFAVLPRCWVARSFYSPLRATPTLLSTNSYQPAPAQRDFSVRKPNRNRPAQLKTEMIIEKTIYDCTESLSTALKKTSLWRKNLAVQYPGDSRNFKAAKQLSELAEETPTLSDEYWKLLKPFFNSNPARWREALSRATREVSFAHDKTSFKFFVRELIGILSESVAA